MKTTEHNRIILKNGVRLYPFSSFDELIEYAQDKKRLLVAINAEKILHATEQTRGIINRIYEIMEENGITDNRRVGLYGITYKENVDDVRESPTLQMLECQERHLARPLKSFDPFFTDKEIVKNQVLDFDEFLDGVDMVVIMVRHNHIKQNWDKLKGKVILDCHNICPIEGSYRI